MIVSPSRHPRHGHAVASTPLRGEALNQVWLHTEPDPLPRYQSPPYSMPSLPPEETWTLAQLKEKTGSMCTTDGLRMEWKHGSVHVWYGDQHESFPVASLYREVQAFRRGQQQLSFAMEV